MATQIKLRRDTYSNWSTSNPVLGLAEPGFDTTNKKLKIGDGTTAWNSLPYFDDKETVLSALTQDIVPADDNVYNIGSPDKRWQHGYFANGSLYIGDIKLSNDTGRLVVQQVTDAGLETEAPIPDTPGVVTTDRIINGDHTFSITANGTLELDGSEFTGGGGSANTGDFTFSTTNIRTPDGSPANITTYDGGEGYARASLDLDPANYRATMTAWWKSSALWTSENGHWTTGEWLAINETNGQLVFTGASDIYEWFTRKYDYVDNLTISVNGGDPISLHNGYSSNYPDYIAIFTDNGFTLDPSTITSIFIEYNPRAKISVRGNGGGIELAGGEGNINISSVETSNLTGRYVNITSTSSDAYNGVTVTTKFDGSGQTQAWTFGADGILRLPYDGILQTGQSRNRAKSGSFNTDTPTVIWSSSANWISSAKLVIQIECEEAMDDTGWHSQACEAIIASRGYSNAGNGTGEPAMTVYGVVHTSINPLVTFTIQRNLTTKVFELLATPTATAAGSGVYYSVTSVEMTTWD